VRSLVILPLDLMISLGVGVGGSIVVSILVNLTLVRNRVFDDVTVVHDVLTSNNVRAQTPALLFIFEGFFARSVEPWRVPCASSQLSR
jgi:hypothetical protein